MDHEWQHFLSLLCVMGIDGNYYRLIPILIYGWVLLKQWCYTYSHSSSLSGAIMALVLNLMVTTTNFRENDLTKK
jgi:hypothetical protein